MRRVKYLKTRIVIRVSQNVSTSMGALTSVVSTRRGWLENVAERWIRSSRWTGRGNSSLGQVRRLDYLNSRNSFSSRFTGHPRRVAPPPGTFERRPGYPFPLVAVQHHGFVPATSPAKFPTRSRSSIFEFFGSVFWSFSLIFRGNSALSLESGLVRLSPVMGY